jgi:Protein of unknown function (DUF1232)
VVWSGILVLFAGAVLTFAVDAEPGGVDLTAVGAIGMVLGACLLIAGILRLNRARRRTHAPAAGAAAPAAYKTGAGKIAAMIAAVVYIVSPIDIIPDVLLPVGVIDDATAFTWLVFAVGQEVARHSRKRRQLR